MSARIGDTACKVAFDDVVLPPVVDPVGRTTSITAIAARAMKRGVGCDIGQNKTILIDGPPSQVRGVPCAAT